MPAKRQSKTISPPPAPGLHDSAIAFLGRDYDQVFQQLRFYDGQIWEITKFSFLQLIASVTAVWTLFNFSHGTDIAANYAGEYVNRWKIFGGGILLISFVFSLLAVWYIMRNRKYFTRTAHYINDQRQFHLAARPLGFANRSGYYTDWQSPAAYDPQSTHWFSVLLILLMGSLLFGFGLGLLTQYVGLGDLPATILGGAAWIIMFVATMFGAKEYQERKDKPGN
jgi:hypothetical protein